MLKTGFLAGDFALRNPVFFVQLRRVKKMTQTAVRTLLERNETNPAKFWDIAFLNEM
jgi:hypothetical protein